MSQPSRAQCVDLMSRSCITECRPTDSLQDDTGGATGTEGRGRRAQTSHSEACLIPVPNRCTYDKNRAAGVGKTRVEVKVQQPAFVMHTYL